MRIYIIGNDGRAALAPLSYLVWLRSSALPPFTLTRDQVSIRRTISHTAL
jgi:hypothetical protein